MNKLTGNSRSKALPIFILVVLLYFPFFTHLSRQSIRLWDESRLATNAYEMMESGNIIVTTYQHQPDLWNVKPPLLIWCQSSLMKIFGPWELALRLPSAICGFMTSIMLLIIGWKYYNRFWLGFAAAIILATVRGYIDEHGTRYGEYDSMVTLFSTFYAFCFLFYFEGGKRKYLYWAMAGMAMAVLTKGIAGLIFGPGILLMAIFLKKIKSTLTDKNFYLALLVFLVPVISFYFIREMMNPGYMTAVLENELGGRFLKTMEEHKEDFWYYYDKLHDFQLQYWSLLIPCGLAVAIAGTDDRIRRLAIYLSVISVSYWLVISFGQTKLFWYSYQMFPLLVFLIAIFIYFVFSLLENYEMKSLRYNILPFIFLVIVIYPPYNSMFNRTYLAPEYPWDNNFYGTSYFLRDVAKGNKKYDGTINILHSSYRTNLEYYATILRKEGIAVNFPSFNDLKSGDTIIVSQDHCKEYLRNHFKLDVVSETKVVSIYKLN